MQKSLDNTKRIYVKFYGFTSNDKGTFRASANTQIAIFMTMKMSEISHFVCVIAVSNELHPKF